MPVGFKRNRQHKGENHGGNNRSMRKQFHRDIFAALLMGLVSLAASAADAANVANGERLTRRWGSSCARSSPTLISTKLSHLWQRCGRALHSM
jgi:hypothetical protein